MLARRCVLRLLREDLAQGVAGGGEIGEPHLGVFAGENDAVGAGVEGGADGLADVVGRGALFGCLGVDQRGDVDVDAGIDLDLSGDAGEGAAGFAGDVIGREAGGGQLVVRSFLGSS